MSELRARLDALLNEAEDKAYRVIADITEAADAVLDSVFEVVDDVQGRVADLKERADQGAAGAGSPFADAWKKFTDAVDNPPAPVQEEESLDSKAKEAYEYLVENDPQWNFHKGKDFWETTYSQTGDYTKQELVKMADKHRAETDLSF